jgi:hypothetical protein
MADDIFRSFRSRDPAARDQAGTSARTGGDPLAELARLIGQSDPYSERVARDGGRSADEPEAPGFDWATDGGYSEEADRAEQRYAAPPAPTLPAASYPVQTSQAGEYEDEPSPSGRFFSTPATKFNGFRDDADTHQPDRQGGYETAEPERDGSEAYASDEYYDEEAPTPKRRSGVVVVAAVLGLVVIGAAGAFAYRTMFGGSMLPTLPPIIKANNGPNKIMPSYGEAQANNSATTGTVGAGSAETVVSREEQPVNVEPKINSRVVSAIPIVPPQSSAQPAAAPPASAPSPWPPSPLAAGTPVTASPAAPSAPVTASVPPAATPAAAPAFAEPKRVHTVTIRTDQAGSSEAAPPAAVPMPVPAPAARSAARPPSPKPATSAAAASAASNAPLSIVPGADGEAAAPMRTRTAAAAPIAMASATPVTGVTGSTPSGSGYAVQITSQRSEADAEASFQALRAKFPTQLGGRQPIIRRADLGAKGVYYRAMVGPFASMEEAAGMCSSLKAAGGNCLVQRN